jgi:putative oxidoreductase
MRSVSEPHIDGGLLLLRLGAGLTMLLFFGIPKLRAAATFMHTGQWTFVDFNRKVGLPAPVLVAYLETLNESVAALLLAIGFLARPAAGCLALGFAGATICSIKFGEEWLMAAYFWLMFSTVLLTGPGKFSIDQVLRSRSGRKALGPDRMEDEAN